MSYYIMKDQLIDTARESAIVHALERQGIYPDKTVFHRRACNSCVVDFHYPNGKVVKVGTYYRTAIVSRDMQTGDMCVDNGGYYGSPLTSGKISGYLSEFGCTLGWSCYSSEKNVELMTERLEIHKVLDPDRFKDITDDYRWSSLPSHAVSISRSMVYESGTIVRNGHIPGNTFLFRDQRTLMRKVAKLIKKMDTKGFKRQVSKNHKHCPECWKYYGAGKPIPTNHLLHHIEEKEPTITLVLAALAACCHGQRYSDDVARRLNNTPVFRPDEGAIQNMFTYDEERDYHPLLNFSMLQVLQGYLGFRLDVHPQVCSSYGAVSLKGHHYSTPARYENFKGDV